VYGQIDEGFDNFDGAGMWVSPGGNTGSHDGDLCFNITGNYLANEFYVFQSPMYDFSTWGTVELLWNQESSVRNGDSFRLYLYDNGWSYYDISNLSGYYGVTVNTTTTALAFVLVTNGSGSLNGRYSHVRVLQISDPTPLPVELLDFSASLQDKGTMLKWSTASENNSLKFDLYKSLNGNTWGMLSEIPAGGFSTSELTYKYFDTRISSGYSYYKLIQIDIDGKEDVYGPVYIYRNVFSEPRKYNLMGQEVNESYKGLIINNGKLEINE
tara:strand:+ start:170 stop:976 length:807 start_codon:yes stop_codon:yes gene_type:complete